MRLYQVLFLTKTGQREKDEFLQKMRNLYGDLFPVSRATRLFNEWQRLRQAPVTHATDEQEILPLLQVVNWDHIAQLDPKALILDPCAGYGTITRVLQQHLSIGLSTQGFRYVTNDIERSTPANYHLDILKPGLWQQTQLANPAVIACSPPFELLDAILPDLTRRAKFLVLCHVPGDYLSNGGPTRRQWWHQIQMQGRTAIIQGLPRTSLSPVRRCIWLIIVKHHSLQEELLILGERTSLITLPGG